MSKEELGYKIAVIRKNKRITQQALAEQLDISQQHLSKIERGIHCPTIDHLMLIAKILQVDLSQLFGEISYDLQEDSYTCDIIKKLGYLDIRQKGEVLGYINRILDEKGISQKLIYK